MLTMKIDGVPELERKLAALASLAPQAAAEALTKNAQPMLEAARARAAVLSGAMRDGIHLDAPIVTEDDASIVMETGTREEMGIPADDPYYYPAGAEYGTSRQPPRPFMRPAFDATAQQVVDDTGRDLGSVLEKKGAV